MRVKKLSAAPRRPQHSVCVGGVVTAEAVETRKAWQRHFAKKLAGVDTELAALLEESDEHQRHMFSKLAGEKVDIEEIPSLSDLSSLLSAVRIGRGHGEDAVPGELF